MMANLVDRMPRDSTGELTDEEGNLGSEEARYNELFVKKVTIGTAVLFSGISTVEISADGGTATVDFTALVDSTGDLHDGGNPSRIVAPDDGVYFLNLNFANLNPDSGNGSVIIRKNGTTNIFEQTLGKNMAFSIDAAISLSASDYIEVRINDTITSKILFNFARALGL